MLSKLIKKIILIWVIYLPSFSSSQYYFSRW